MNFLSFWLAHANAKRSSSVSILRLVLLTQTIAHDYISTVSAQSSIVYVKIVVLLISLWRWLHGGPAKALNTKPKELHLFVLITLLALLLL